MLELHPDAPAALRATALTGAGNLAYNSADYVSAKRFYQQCLKVSRAAGNQHAVANALASLGNIACAERQSEQAWHIGGDGRNWP